MHVNTDALSISMLITTVGHQIAITFLIGQQWKFIVNHITSENHLKFMTCHVVITFLSVNEKYRSIGTYLLIWPLQPATGLGLSLFAAP